METLTVTVTGGLGNRFNVVASALAIEDTGIPVTIIWPPTYDCRIGFDDLFEPVENIKRSVPNLPQPYICLDGAQYDRLKTSKHVYLLSYGRFFSSPNSTKLFRSLKPRKEYLDAVATLFANRVVVGIHIRRTDNQHSIDNSPTELFLEAMAAYPVTTFFFLATDSEFEKTKLRDAFGSRILTFDVPLNRGTLVGMRAAFTDWLALSKCTEILGSYMSRFSETAAEFGAVPLRVLKM